MKILDIGANIGLWTLDMCKQFDHVIAFEPVEEFRECLIRNAPYNNLEIRNCALGEIDAAIEDFCQVICCKRHSTFTVVANGAMNLSSWVNCD